MPAVSSRPPRAPEEPFGQEERTRRRHPGGRCGNLRRRRGRGSVRDPGQGEGVMRAVWPRWRWTRCAVGSTPNVRRAWRWSISSRVGATGGIILSIRSVASAWPVPRRRWLGAQGGRGPSSQAGRELPEVIETQLLRQAFAMTNHNQQNRQGGHSTSGEAGCTFASGWICREASPRSFPRRNVCLLGQVVTGVRANSTKRSGSENQSGFGVSAERRKERLPVRHWPSFPRVGWWVSDRVDCRGSSSTKSGAW